MNVFVALGGLFAAAVIVALIIIANVDSVLDNALGSDDD